ncbi:NYN domain-containing protein [Haloferula sp.]|uniref:NYN domain-containing protein n=1 Tax=Haloferula sp. TaxID=2497595 RepID=UPI003C72F329
MSTPAKLAVLIDADNASPAAIDSLLDEVATYGSASVKRIYGDWTNTRLSSWKNALPEHAIQPIQQFANTRGKNSTDSAMIIDAMDLLYTERFDGFCLVTSDSDFTRLASRIRENGLSVYGFGERKTPKPFVSACTEFIYVETIEKTQASKKGKAVSKGSTKSSSPREIGIKQFKGSSGLINSMRSAITDLCEEDGWANLSSVNSRVKNAHSDFLPKNYGYAKLSELLQATGFFEIRRKGQSVEVRDAKAS